MAEASFIITREELYRRVWEVPFKQLITEYGTTYGNLRRLADDLDVPRPPSGHWNKLAAGNAAERPPLPDLKPGKPRSRKVVRSQAAGPEGSEYRRHIETIIGEVKAPKTLARPHPLVARWITERRHHQRHSVRQNTLSSSFFIKSETDDRRHRILQAIIPTLEGQGARISGDHDEGPIEARFAGATITFRLREKLRQVRRPLTADEVRRSFGSPSSYHIELHPTGVLSLKIETYTGISWCSWEDDRRGPLENRLTDIIVTILMARQSLIHAARRAQDERERQLEREKQRRLEAEARQREEARWAAFVEMGRQSDEAVYLRRFLARLSEAGLPPEERYGDRTVAEWLAWISAKIEGIDPLASGPANLIKRLASYGA